MYLQKTRHHPKGNWKTITIDAQIATTPTSILCVLWEIRFVFVGVSTMRSKNRLLLTFSQPIFRTTQKSHPSTTTITSQSLNILSRTDWIPIITIFSFQYIEIKKKKWSRPDSNRERRESFFRFSLLSARNVTSHPKPDSSVYLLTPNKKKEREKKERIIINSNSGNNKIFHQ